MTRFEIVTEADARLLEPGSSIILAIGGHITPLASDTLRAKRIAVVREGSPDADAALLAPVSDIRIVAIAGDHTSLQLKTALVAHLRGRGIAAHDVGTATPEPVDYPDTAARAAVQVARKEADAGIVIDGGGLGSAMAANKVPGVRAAMCTSVTLARYARQHNGANVLALGATLITAGEAVAIVDAFLDTPMRDPRDIQRLAKIRELELRPPT